MTDDWKIQVSPKLADGTLINLRANDPNEAEQILSWAINNAGKITETVAAFTGSTNVTAAMPGSQVVSNAGPAWSGGQQAAPQQAPQAAPQPQGDAKVCLHGAMTYREGTGKNSGKPYRAYFCPAPRGSAQCDPVFVR